MAHNNDDKFHKDYHIKKAAKRFDGIAAATKKLTKENAEAMGLDLTEEELDELSKKTLGSYVKKAHGDAISNSRQGERAASNSNDYSRRAIEKPKKSEGYNRLANEFDKTSRAYHDKSAKRSAGIIKATNKLTKD